MNQGSRHMECAGYFPYWVTNQRTDSKMHTLSWTRRATAHRVGQGPQPDARFHVPSEWSKLL